MGMKPRDLPSGGLSGALFSATQGRVLGLVFGQPERSFYASEIIALVRGGSGAVQRELARLEQSGLVTTRRIGNQKHYQANPSAPIYAELTAIVRKTVGLVEPLRHALAPLSARISAALVFGSIAKGEDSAGSDIDLLIVSDELGYGAIYAALEPLHSALGRKVNPTLFTPADLNRQKKAGKAFVKRVLAQPKLWVIGTDDDLAP